MALRLALAMGEPNPDRLLERVTSAQLDEWRAYFALQDEDDLEDFKVEDELANLRAARVCSAIGNFAGKQARRILHPSDFMPGEHKQESVGDGLFAAFASLGVEEAAP